MISTGLSSFSFQLTDKLLNFLFIDIALPGKIFDGLISSFLLRFQTIKLGISLLKLIISLSELPSKLTIHVFEFSCFFLSDLCNFSSLDFF
jgi:hypothetical protein